MTVLYGSDSWTLAKIYDKFERKIRLNFYGPSYVNGIWRIKYELHKLLKNKYS